MREVHRWVNEWPPGRLLGRKNSNKKKDDSLKILLIDEWLLS